MVLPKQDGARKFKYGRPTKTFSFKFPVDLIRRIRDEKIDAGQVLFDILEHGNSGGSELLEKIIRIFVLEEVDASKYIEEFDDEELDLILKIRQEVSP